MLKRLGKLDVRHVHIKPAYYRADFGIDRIVVLERGKVERWEELVVLASVPPQCWMFSASSSSSIPCMPMT